ncbi:GNAT family N-acetyltransferase [Pseudomonas sp. 21LCFQ02]|uniref:GNAT family N-acetyltransferase n=1 Tax=unclassified Pseudomonas TaxID=196821 RepID=UPI002097E31F|nr:MULTISPECIES: GNAT family N-acetyltransferase [unclassified Pseudomonas]MCO8166103.1 GNAT family N-acetyltransferase [Pseudomonas sp. 21LCFQ010]MCO8171697.1 GNAT family N-acetyltransferase [Pseudomonas sp. 21LCFQ02]MCQ9427449.1 GNAT family N-acetyltransferase [Pseudomonas sp. LJDD11]
MQMIDCTEQHHAQAILDIFNHEIRHSTALYDYQPWDISVMKAWFETKRAGNFPVIGVQGEQGQLLGFATYGTFRTRAAYKYSVEHSVYIHPDHRGAGLGKYLLGSLIEQARSRGVHTLVGGIDLGNQASIHLHERMGFERSGVIREAAYKFGQWLDLVFYQKVLDTPLVPNED